MATRVLRAQALGPTLLSYRAPGGCPSALEFQRSVQRRTTRVRFVEQGPHDRELSIAMRKDGDYIDGDLRLIESDGGLRKRSVRFTSCAEAVEGLALIAVVSLDPQALLEPDTPAKPAAAPTAVPVSKAPTPAPRAPSPPPTPAAKPSSKTQLALGVEFALAFRALPEAALGGALFLDVASGSRSSFAPLLRMAISHVERRGLSSDSGAEANFTLTLGTLTGCPWRFAAGPLALRPCAFASGGALHVWGVKTTNLQHRTRPYGALGGSLLLLARVSQSIEFVADIALGATLVQDSFGFDPDQPWQNPSLYLTSGLGVRFVFP